MSEPAEVQASAAAATASDEEDRRKARLLVMGGTTLLVLGALVYSGFEFGPPGVVLILVGVALVAVIASFWSSLRTLIGETRLSGADAFAIGAPRAEEEQKRAILRALKDLEFERGVGKISEQDFVMLSQRYREEGKRLLRQIDLASAEQRERALEIVNQRLRKLGLGDSIDIGAAEAAASAAATRPAFEPLEPAKKEAIASTVPDAPSDAADGEASAPSSKPPTAAKSSAAEEAATEEATEEAATEAAATEEAAAEEAAAEKRHAD